MSSLELDALLDGRSALSSTAIDGAEPLDRSADRARLARWGFRLPPDGRLHYGHPPEKEAARLRSLQEDINADAAIGRRLDFVAAARRANRRLLAGTVYSKSGWAGRNRHYALKKHDRFAHPDEIARRLRGLRLWMSDAETRLHPVAVAAVAYGRAITIHPFYNANGRSWRLAVDRYLQERGYLPPIFSSFDDPFKFSRSAEELTAALARGILRSRRRLAKLSLR